MKDVYETNISNAKWIVYDILGNTGWIAYTVCLILAFIKYGEYLSLNIVGLVPALLILLGLGELISERIAKLDRILPKRRLFLGFGSVTLGGAAGIVISAIAAILHFNTVYLIMLIGAVLCSLFCGLLFFGYKKRQQTDSDTN